MKRLFLTSSVAYVAHDIAKRTNTKGLKLAFILTPTEVEEGDLGWLRKDREALINAGFELTDYTFTGKTRKEVKNFLKDFDVLYMSGGNTYWFLKKVQEADCADVIRDFVDSGKIYISTSAGTILAGPDIYPTRNLEKLSKVPELKDFKGLGLVNFIIMPHWGDQDFEERYKRTIDAYYNDYPILLLSNQMYVMVEEDKFEIIKV